MMPGTVTKISESIIASATTIAPLSDLVLVSGTTNIATITPPPNLGGISSGILLVVPTNAAGLTFLTTGNISGTTSIVCTTQKVVAFVYSASQAKWYPGAVS